MKILDVNDKFLTKKAIKAICTPPNQYICNNFYRFNMRMLLVNFQRICLGGLGLNSGTVSELKVRLTFLINAKCVPNLRQAYE